MRRPPPPRQGTYQPAAAAEPLALRLPRRSQRCPDAADAMNCIKKQLLVRKMELEKEAEEAEQKAAQKLKGSGGDEPKQSLESPKEAQQKPEESKKKAANA